MVLVLFGLFKFQVELYRCENCCGQLVGEVHILHHIGHKLRPCYNLMPLEFPRVLFYLVSGKISKK